MIPPSIRLSILASTVLLAGCVSMGISEMSPEQIRAAEGLVTCTQIYSAWGRGVATSINVDDVRKGATSKGAITVAPDCGVTIRHDVGVEREPETINSKTQPEILK
jgi:hypothetical protein